MNMLSKHGSLQLSAMIGFINKHAALPKFPGCTWNRLLTNTYACIF